jgi:hypothetical protein
MQTQGNRCGKVLLVMFVAGTLSACLEMGDSSSAGTNNPPPPDDSNTAPTISGTPASQVVVGNSYSFTPTANDTDGDTLTFAVENQPEWTEFNAATGNLSGMATQGTEGMYGDIRISTSDGTATSSLPEFSIEVTQAANGTVTLSWTAPTENTDGSTLTDLDSYTIYYGQESGNYTNEVQVTNAGLTTFVLENLTPDTYYFVITASNNVDMESDYSNEVPHTLN